MATSISRVGSAAPFKVSSDLATGQRIPFSAVAGGLLIVTSGSGTIQWHVTHDANVEAVPLKDTKGVDVTTVAVEGEAVELPSALYGAQFVVGLAGDDIEGFICKKG
jgi:hypothetical protein